MLVLTRKKNDVIIIDGRIKIEVLKVKGSGIRLGITAPDEPRAFIVDNHRRRVRRWRLSRVQCTGRHISRWVHLFGTKCRAIKDNKEIGKMERAVAIAQDSLTATFPIIRQGASEQEIAEIESKIEELRASGELDRIVREMDLE